MRAIPGLLWACIPGHQDQAVHPHGIWVTLLDVGADRVDYPCASTALCFWPGGLLWAVPRGPVASTFTASRSYEGSWPGRRHPAAPGEG